jgi:hypothetical protein
VLKNVQYADLVSGSEQKVSRLEGLGLRAAPIAMSEKEIPSANILKHKQLRSLCRVGKPPSRWVASLLRQECVYPTPGIQEILRNSANF